MPNGTTAQLFGAISEKAFSATTSHSPTNSLAWHIKLGHLSFTTLQETAKRNLALGLPSTKFEPFTCPSCDQCKITQLPYASADHLPREAKLGLIHADICGPVPASKEGHRYFLTLIDDATRYKWVFPLRSKDLVSSTI